MSAKVYSKSAKRAEHALRATGENRLYLTDAEENTLRKALDEQCDTYNIKGLKLKLIQTVFRQTIGFNKREDDLTGVRLQKLVGSRRDYCNKYVTEMIDQSILIFRRGYYGRILSINYNFDDWGKAPEDVKTQRSEPEKILQNKQKENEENLSANALHEHSASTAPALRDQNKIEEQDAGLHSHAAHENEINKALGEPLSENIIKQLLPGDITRLITQDVLKQLADTLMIGIKTVLEQLTPQILQQLTGLQAQTATQSEPKIELPTDIAIANTSTTNTPKPEEKPPEIPAEKPPKIIPETTPNVGLDAPKTNENHSPIDTQTQPSKPILNHYDTLTFPKQLKPFEQNQIQSILTKEQLDDPQNAQRILDSMASRFALDMPPIKSPIAYFRSLLNKCKAGNFESSYADTFVQQSQETQNQQQQDTEKEKRREHQEKYQAAKHYYKMLKLHTENSGKTLQQLAKDLGWTDLLEEMGFDLSAQPSGEPTQ